MSSALPRRSEQSPEYDQGYQAGRRTGLFLGTLLGTAVTSLSILLGVIASQSPFCGPRLLKESSLPKRVQLDFGQDAVILDSQQNRAKINCPGNQHSLIRVGRLDGLQGNSGRYIHASLAYLLHTPEKGDQFIMKDTRGNEWVLDEKTGCYIPHKR